MNFLQLNQSIFALNNMLQQGRSFLVTFTTVDHSTLRMFDATVRDGLTNMVNDVKELVGSISQAQLEVHMCLMGTDNLLNEYAMRALMRVDTRLVEGDELVVELKKAQYIIQTVLDIEGSLEPRKPVLRDIGSYDLSKLNVASMQITN